MSIRLFQTYTRFPFSRKTLRYFALTIYKNERIKPQQHINIIFCSDHKIRTLNTKFRHKDTATDVLSFNYNEKDLLGEIYISLQRADIQARQMGHSLDEELKRLITHGMIHLLGYDHASKKDTLLMNEKESRYCRI